MQERPKVAREGLILEAHARHYNMFGIILPGRIGKALGVGVIQPQMNKAVHEVGGTGIELERVIVAARILELLELVAEPRVQEQVEE